MSYIWVNAGMDYITFGGISMYIKYKDRKGPFSERQYPTGYLIKLIDRELFITKAGFKDLTTYLPMESYDYCLNMDIVGKNTVVTHNGIMFTYNDKTLKRPFSYDKDKLSTFLLGDCVTGDTHIFTTKGMFEIRDLISETGKVKDLFVSTPSGVKECTKVFKSEKRKVNELTTTMGYTIKATDKELFYTHKGWKKMEDIEVGDRVAIILGKNIWSDTPVKFNFNYEKYIQDKCIDVPEIIKCKICGEEFKKLDSHVFSKHNMTVSKYKKKYDVRYTTCRSVKISSHLDARLDDIELPKTVTLELARLLGYLIGDGQVRPTSFNISCGVDRDFAEDALFCINTVFPELKARIEESVTSEDDGGKYVHGTGVTIYTIYSQWSSKLMAFLEYIGCPHLTAREKRVPWCILQSNKKIVTEFLKGLMECDGSAHINGVEYCSHSTKLRREVRSLFTNLGILSNLIEHKTTKLPSGETVNKHRGRVCVSTVEAIVKYRELIGFISKRKKNNLNKSIEQRRLNQSRRNKQVRDEKLLLFSDVTFWDIVTEIKQLNKKKITYDFTIDEVHTYIANGFYVHNSGGFQLVSGVKEFIDPLDLAKWHSAYIQQGMTLDLPPFYGVSDEYVLKSGLIQAKNNEVLIQNCENVELYNVSHGFNMDQIKRHIDIVDNDTMKKWAIGGSYYGNLFDLINSIFSVINYKKSDSYHIFGISNTKILPLFAWIGKYYNITSDSSTPLQAGTSTIFFSTIEKILKKIRVGRVDSKLLHSDKLYPYLPCSCPICNALKTSEIFIKSNNSCVLHVLLSLHNVIAMSNYTKIWDDLATNSSIKEYKKILDSMFERKANLWKQSIDYIEYIMEHNLEKANIKFASYFSLFNSDSIQISDFSMFNNDTTDYKKVNEQRMDKIIDNYSKYYDDDFTKKIRRNTKKIDKLESTKYAKESIGIKTGNKSNSLKKKKKKRKEE